MVSESDAAEPGLVIVTGASRGIGRETVVELVRAHSAKVLAVSRDAEALSVLQTELGEKQVAILPLDLAIEGAPERIVHALNAARVRCVVHNAGLLYKAPIGEHAAEGLSRCFQVNTIAPLLLTQALLSSMAGVPDAHIVHIGSMGGFQDSAKFPGLVGYSASKAALACMAQCLAEDLKPYGIRSNCLALGSADTEMLRAAFPGYKAATSAASMARFVAWFAMHGQEQFNGRVLPVSSGTP